ncbi:MAG TPA: inositol monophosphatase family protein [Kofleriaceae bacterium]|nr:inositol monophosphatase family protein [Kofleriaceae bacterium]
MSDLGELLAIGSRAARAAGELLRTARPEHIRGKSTAKDLVTEWDVRSEETIRAILEPTGIAVMGEEKDGTRRGDTHWIVDPIDGTVNFAHGLPLWCVSIALEQAGELTVGVVYAPLLDWWFEATRGGGARDGAGTVLHVSECPSLDKAMLATGFPYIATTAENYAEWEHFSRAATCRRLGAAALDLCLVARGWFDGYWERDLQAWDMAAGALIVVEAGGTVTNTLGARFDVHSGEAVASNGAIHSELITELAKVRK